MSSNEYINLKGKMTLHYTSSLLLRLVVWLGIPQCYGHKLQVQGTHKRTNGFCIIFKLLNCKYRSDPQSH